MKRKSPSSSCSSSSSSCCIESPLIASNNGPESKPEITKPKPKPKRVRAKKNQSDNSATSEVQVEEVHVKQETNSTPPDEVQADEGAVAHEDPHLQVVVEASPPPKEEPKDSNESEGGGIVVMEPIEEHEHPWDLCLDTLFNILPIPDMPLGKASEVFDYKGFDDDIESIFDEPLDDNGILQYGCQIDADALVAEGMKGRDATNSPSSSPLSSTASACSNI